MSEQMREPTATSLLSTAICPPALPGRLRHCNCPWEQWGQWSHASTPVPT